MFWVDKFTEEVKEKIIDKASLLEERKELVNRIEKGRDFFKKAKNSGDVSKVLDGLSTLIGIIEELREIDKKINDIDITVVSLIEAYMSNFTAKFKMPARLNDAGDLIKHDEVYAVPYAIETSDRLEVTPNDIWFLKMIKEAYKANNIELLPKKGDFNNGSI